MCLLYQCRAQILMLILHERNLSFVSERCFFLFGCFAPSSQVCSSRSLGKEARGSGGTGTKLMVMSRKIFWIVGCKIDFARAMLHIKARDGVFINQDVNLVTGTEIQRRPLGVTQNGLETWLCSKMKQSRAQLEVPWSIYDFFFPVMLFF